VNRNYSSLQAKLRRRDGLIRQLEITKTTVIIRANHQRKPLQRVGDDDYNPSQPLWMKYLHQKHRPSIRLPIFPWLPTIPFIRPRVNAIHYLRAEVARYNLEIECHQHHLNEFTLINSAFIHFNGILSTPLAALAFKAQIPPS
jgi:hypothetical protein